MSKVCKVCNIEKSLDDYHKSKRHRDGRLNECRICYNKRILDLKDSNPEFRQRTIQNSKNYKKRHPEKVKKANELYRENNREFLRFSYSEYTKNNKEKVKEQKKRYVKDNPHMITKTKVRRRVAEKRAVPSWVDHDKIKIVYLKAKWLESLTGMKYHVDHIIPLQGKNVCGLHCWANLQILEASLNCSKQNQESFVMRIDSDE